MVHLKFQLSNMLNGLRKKKALQQKNLGKKNFRLMQKHTLNFAAEFTSPCKTVNYQQIERRKSKAFIEKITS